MPERTPEELAHALWAAADAGDEKAAILLPFVAVVALLRKFERGPSLSQPVRD